MKQKLLFLGFVALSFVAFSQNNILPPEPCGLNPYFLCDENEDGIEVFNLVDFYPFNFCKPREWSVNYHPTTFYVTKEDSQNGTNAIINPESYINISNPQTIYSRAEPLNPSTDEVLTYSDKIEASLTVDSDGDGLTNCEETLGIDDPSTPLDPGTYGVDASNPSDPRNSCDPINISTVDTDGDGLTNCEEITGQDSINTTCDPVGNITNPNVSNFTCENKEIRVYAFLDANSNGTFETGEEIISNSGSFTYELNDDGMEQNIASSGDYIAIFDDVLSNSYDFTFNFNDDSNCYMPSNSLENVSVILGESSEFYIPITSITCNDIEVNLWPQISPRPGFDYYNRFKISNIGSLTSSGTVEFTHHPLVDFVQVFNLDPGNTITPTATGFILNYNDLEPLNFEFIIIQMYVPPTVSLGELITNTVTYNSTPIEVDTTNDHASLTEEVIGSYDPNDKMESHGEEVLYDDFVTSNEYLYYTVRFQNVGTAEAITVRIEDALSTLLDTNTFQMIQSSHDYQVNRDGNQLIWTFNDINLPAESQDADGSNGFVYFKIKPLSGYSVGTVIPAQAEIYFDFNAPVITNTFETTFVEENLSVSDSKFNAFTIYPNPAEESVRIKFNISLNNNAEIEIYDLKGRIVLRNEVKTTSQQRIDVGNLSAGVYLLKLKDASRETVKKLIIK